MTRRVLLVGATGVFGSRLATLLAMACVGLLARDTISARGRGWSFAGAPLPLRLASRVHARACAARARYSFCVAVAHPWLGLLFADRGRLDA